MSLAAKFSLASTLARVALRSSVERIHTPARPTELSTVPGDAEDLTMEWLTAALCRQHPGAEVIDFELGGGTSGTTTRRAITVMSNYMVNGMCASGAHGDQSPAATREGSCQAIARGAGDDVAEDLVELMAVMTEVMSTDPECTALLEAMTPRTALHFMSAPDSEVHPVVMEVLAPLHARAEQAGLLREDVSLHDMAMWSRVALAPLAQRDQLPPAELRDIVRRFVLPAFLRDRRPSAPDRPTTPWSSAAPR